MKSMIISLDMQLVTNNWQQTTGNKQLATIGQQKSTGNNQL